MLDCVFVFVVIVFKLFLKFFVLVVGVYWDNSV